MKKIHVRIVESMHETLGGDLVLLYKVRATGKRQTAEGYIDGKYLTDAKRKEVAANGYGYTNVYPSFIN